MTLLLASLLAFASPAVATAPNTDPASPPVAAPQEKPKKEKKICRPEERTVSRITKMICKTAAEWQESDAASHDDRASLCGSACRPDLTLRPVSSSGAASQKAPHPGEAAALP
eukprot:gene37047-49987_t